MSQPTSRMTGTGLPKGTILLFTFGFFFVCGISGSEQLSWLHFVAVQGVFVVFVLTVVRHLCLLGCAVLERSPQPGADAFDALVTVIVPAYNEEDVIGDALSSIAMLEYKNIEVVVVDDGSTDSTAVIAEQYAASRPDIDIRVIRQTNHGKSTALNTGITHAQGEFILCIDADSRVRAGSIVKGVRYFDDPRVGAVGGFVAVANRRNLLCRFQSLEYLVGLNFLRRALSYFSSVTVVPGPVGLFRRKALGSVGGYREDSQSFAEDADLTVRLLAAGWRVKGCSDMIAYTEVPESMFALLRQRYRWKRGIYQALNYNIYELITGRSFRSVAIACYLVLDAFVLDVVNFGMLCFFLSSFFIYGKVNLVFSWFVLLVALDLMTIVFACRNHGNRMQWLLLSMVQKVSYGVILLTWGIFSLVDEWRSTSMSWDKLARQGHLAEGDAP